MNRIILFAFSAFFVCCFCSFKEPKYVVYIDKITKKFTEKIKQKYSLFYVGGGGAFMYNIEEVSLSYDTCKYRMSKEEARVLIVDCTEKLLKMINESKKVRPYLIRYPFTSNEINISICFSDYGNPNNLSYVEEKYVAHVFVARGEIYYSYYDPEKDILIRIYKEPYFEGLRIVQEQRGMINGQSDEKGKELPSDPVLNCQKVMNGLGVNP